MKRSKGFSNPIREGSPIRLTHCIGSMRLGGAEKQLAELITHLPKDQYRQSLVLFRAEGPLIERIRAVGCEVVDLGFKMRYRKYDPRAWFDIVKTLIRFVRHLRSFKPHILHAQLYWANVLSVLAARFSPVPIVITSRLQLSDYKKGKRWMQQLENWANKHTTAVFANSDAVRRDVLKYEKIDREIIHIIHNGVTLESFQQIDPAAQRREFDIRDGHPVIIAVANLHPYKGHDDLILAVGQLVGRFPAIKVLLPGRDQGSRKILERIIRDQKLSDHVFLLGERQDIPQLLAVSDIVVHPSHQEGFSNSILEGMMAAKPLVVTNVGGNPEAVENNVNGFVVPTRDPEALARALTPLIQDRLLRHKMGIASRERIERDFSMQKMVRKFDQWYVSLIEKTLD